MFDIWWGDIELTTLTLILAVCVVLPGQLLLCFRAKNQTIRLLPVIVFTALALLFILMSVSTTGWDVLGAVILAILSAILLLASGIGWGIWAIVSVIKKKKEKGGE